MNQEVDNLPHTPVEFAGLLEYWFDEYAHAWRERNKESELYRVREAIMYACKELRKMR